MMQHAVATRVARYCININNTVVSRVDIFYNNNHDTISGCRPPL